MAIYKRNSSTERKGKITYNAGIVNGIVALAVSDVSGVALKKSNKKQLDLIKIVFNGESVDVDITVDIFYGYNIPDVAYNIQQSVKHNVESMSKYKVNSVDVHVEGVMFQENQE